MSDEIVDLNEVLERVQHDRELLLELFDIFLADCPPKMEQLKTASKNKNAEQIKTLAHGLKGASANIAAKKLNASFVAIENKVKEGALDDLPDLVASLGPQIDELRVYYKKLSHEFKATE